MVICYGLVYTFAYRHASFSDGDLLKLCVWGGVRSYIYANGNLQRVKSDFKLTIGQKWEHAIS